MDVIGHQAPCENLHIGMSAALRDQLHIAPVVGIAEERLQTPVATLGDMVGDMVGNSRGGNAGALGMSCW